MTVDPDPPAPRPPGSDSLAARHPRLTVALTALWALAVGALAAGLALPAIRIVRFRLFEDRHSILETVAALWSSGDLLLAAVIGVFSVATPCLKLALLAWLWFAAGPGAAAAASRRQRVAGFLDAIGKWSMLDVLAVAVVVAALGGGFVVRAEIGPGIYAFCAATLLTMGLGAAAGVVARRDSAPR